MNMEKMYYSAPESSILVLVPENCLAGSLRNGLPDYDETTPEGWDFFDE